MKENLTALVLLLSLLMNGALAGFLVNRKIETEIQVVQTRDTIIERVPFTVQAPIPEPRIIHSREVDSIYITDTLRVREADIPRRRVYQDSIDQDGARIHYRHQVTGFLNESVYTLDLPQRTITDSITRTITERYDPRLQFSVSTGYLWPTPVTQPGIETGLMVQYKDWGAYYRYDPINKMHSTGALYRFMKVY